MTMKTFALKAKLARRLPDPVYGGDQKLQHHIFLVNTRDIPRDLPMEANARRPNTRKQIYRRVKESLLEGDSTFHLKNKGIVIVADLVAQKAGTHDEYTIRLNPDAQGILDGGHTYQLIVDAQEAGELPEDQFVFVQVRTGIPIDWIPDISQGLNTSVQVQDMSLDNLAKRFEWLKELIKDTPYVDKVAWSENDEGDYDARDLIALLYLFNTALFPSSVSHPIAGYEKKKEALKAYEEDPASFKALTPLAKQIFELHDYVAGTARDLYNAGALDHGKRGRGAALSFVKHRAFQPTFLEQKEPFKTQLEDAALYPILAALRVYVERSAAGKLKWAGGFTAVKNAWEKMAYELMLGTLNTAHEVGRSNNAIGKSRLHWDGIYKTIQNYRLEQRLQA